MFQVSGAAAKFVQTKFGGIFKVLPNVVAVGTSQIIAAPNNPDRIVLAIINVGTTQITLSYGSPVVAGQGILLLDQGSIYTVNADQDGILPTWPHYAISNVAGGSLYVVSTQLEGA